MKKLEKAKEHFLNGELTEANKIYKKILTKEPKNTAVINLLSTLYISQNNLEEAEKSINNAIELDGSNGLLYQTKGVLQAKKGEIEESEKAFKTALKMNPNLYESQVALGNIYSFKGEKSKATKHYRMGNKINDVLADSHLGLAKIYMSDGDVSEALNTISKVRLNDTNQLAIQRMMALLYLERGSYEEAENYLEDILKIYPTDDISSLYLGLAKLQSGEVEKADELIYRFNDKYKNTIDGIASIGLLMFKNNNFEQAIVYLEKATREGFVPWSWKEALYEAKIKTNDMTPAIEFYEKLEHTNNKTNFRLGELYQLIGEDEKALKQFKKIEENDGFYISSLLNVSRIYSLQKKDEKAFISYQKVLKAIPEHAEAKLFEINYLLDSGDKTKAKELLGSINYKLYNDSFERTAKLIYALILDKEGLYLEAMTVFKELQAKEDEGKIVINKFTENEANTISGLTSKLDDKRKDPVFVLGLESTSISQFSRWLSKQGLKVFADRLKGKGRDDILSSYIEVPLLSQLDEDLERLERRKYFKKARTIKTELNKNDLVVDFMYINIYQVALIKKFFPKAKVVLLSRDTPDIWLNQKIIKREVLDSIEWNETINQIILMGLELTQINIDKWKEGDNNTIKELSHIFGQKLEYQNTKESYWKRKSFKKGHWKNYKQFLGQ